MAGKTRKAAYEKVFGKKKNAETMAYMLCSDPLVKERLKELQKAAVEKAQRKAILTRERIIRELEAVAFADIKDFAEISEGGDEGEGQKILVVKNLSDIPKEKRAAVASVNQGKNGVSIKLNDKFKAIELLEKQLSILEEKDTEEKENEEMSVNIKIC